METRPHPSGHIQRALLLDTIGFAAAAIVILHAVAILAAQVLEPNLWTWVQICTTHRTFTVLKLRSPTWSSRPPGDTSVSHQLWWLLATLGCSDGHRRRPVSLTAS